MYIGTIFECFSMSNFQFGHMLSCGPGPRPTYPQDYEKPAAFRQGYAVLGNTLRPVKDTPPQGTDCTPKQELNPKLKGLSSDRPGHY